MPAPLLVQMERQIERELAGEELRPDDSALGLVPCGPQPQLVTNDLRSLDERVRDLVERCTCPTQFPMVRVSEGKYRIGDTKMLIFVRVSLLTFFLEFFSFFLFVGKLAETHRLLFFYCPSMAISL